LITSVRLAADNLSINQHRKRAVKLKLLFLPWEREGDYMAKTKKAEIDYAAELQKSFDRWEHLNIYGGNDPCWSDGVNMNLVRNHIIIGKRRIEESMPKEQYPQIYYRETPL
jgi:hypothetical protein